MHGFPITFCHQTGGGKWQDSKPGLMHALLTQVSANVISFAAIPVHEMTHRDRCSRIHRCRWSSAEMLHKLTREKITWLGWTQSYEEPVDTQTDLQIPRLLLFCVQILVGTIVHLTRKDLDLQRTIPRCRCHLQCTDFHHRRQCLLAVSDCNQSNRDVTVVKVNRATGT